MLTQIALPLQEDSETHQHLRHKHKRRVATAFRGIHLPVPEARRHEVCVLFQARGSSLVVSAAGFVKSLCVCACVCVFLSACLPACAPGSEFDADNKFFFLFFFLCPESYSNLFSNHDSLGSPTPDPCPSWKVTLDQECKVTWAKSAKSSKSKKLEAVALHWKLTMHEDIDVELSTRCCL